MDASDGLTFRDSMWLWALLLIPLVAVLLIARERVRAEQSRRFIAERIRGRSNGVRFLRPWLLALAIACVLIAAAGPQFGYREEEVTIAGAGRVFVLDVSESMAATDLGSSRIHAAKAVMRSLLEIAPGRVSLLVFEAEPLVLSPFTEDVDAVATLLDSLTVAETERAGSDIGEALLAALEIARQAAPDPSDVVILSDGEHQGGNVSAAIERARQNGIPVHTIMLGTREGASIRTGGGGGSDRDGRLVQTRASDEVLSRMAQQTGGRFIENPFVGDALQRALPVRGGEQRQGSTIIRIPNQWFQVPLFASLLLFFAAGILNRGAE